MLQYIAREYRGVRRAKGIQRPFDIVELWTSPVGGSWILVATDMDQNTCIIAHGDDLNIVPLAAAPKATPAG